MLASLLLELTAETRKARVLFQAVEPDEMREVNLAHAAFMDEVRRLPARPGSREPMGFKSRGKKKGKG